MPTRSPRSHQTTAKMISPAIAIVVYWRAR
jgi:hypothetical protein